MDLPAAPAPARLNPRQTALLIPPALLLLVIVFVPFPGLHNQYIRAALDFCHFSLAAGACWFLWVRMRWPGWMAFTSVVVAAALCEVIQGFTGRCPNLIDFVRGLFGALAVLICLSALRPSAPPARWIGASLFVVAVSAWPVSEFLYAAAKFCVRVSSGVG